VRRCAIGTPGGCGGTKVPGVISSGHLFGYLLASFVLIVIPGPSVLFVVGRGLAYGRRTALATVVGGASGNYVVAVAVAFGLGAVVQQSVLAFTAVKLAGAGYLIWLGIKAIRGRRGLAEAFTTAAPPRAGRSAVREGFLVGVTNPKALILFGAVLPQFVNRAAGDVQLQMLLLAAMSVAIGLVTDSVWGVSASAVRSWFGRSPRRLEVVGGTGGLAMIAVGLTVAVTGRRS
jgi:threonine/homoserine/homoserine lactone efflux protein